MDISPEGINVAGVLVGQICHIIKKKTEEEPGASESGIFYRWVVKRPINTVVAALAGIGASIGITSGEVAAVMSPLMLFINGVITGIAANSSLIRPGDG